MIPIIDAHLDLAWNATSFNRDLTLPVADLRQREAHMTDMRARGKCTITLPELRRAGVGVCVATLLARSGPAQTPKPSYNRIDLDYATPDIAYATAQGQLAYYRLLEHQGHITLLYTRRDLEAHWAAWLQDRDHTPLGVILSMEGCDPIVTPEQAEAWWQDGLRAAGLTHYGQGQYGFGTASVGPLSPRGFDLLRAFSDLGFALDVTHLCDESMAQALDFYEGPVLASHHNCRTLVPGDRQLTDEQIRQLIERDAVIGVAFDGWMLFPNWIRGQTKPDVVGLDAVADHIDHVCQMSGNTRHSAIGSDLDGGFGSDQSPRDLDTFSDIQKLALILSDRGYSDKDIEAIFYGNWLRFFSNVLPE